MSDHKISEVLSDALTRLSPESIYTDGSHHFKQSGDRLRGGCPFHRSKSNTSFVVTRSTKQWYCAGCQIGGGPIQYFHRLNGGDGNPRGEEFIQLAKQICDQAGVDFPEPTAEDEERFLFLQERSALLENVIDFCKAQLTEAHCQYLQSRGFSRQDIETLEIGFYDIGKLRKHLKGYSKTLLDGSGVLWSKLDGYLVFPWRDDKGRALTLYFKWTSKNVPDGLPKTTALQNPKLNGQAVLSSKYVPYLFDRTRGNKDLVLVEGVTDAALAQVRGDSRVIACVAASLSEGQVRTLKRHGITSVAICLDPDSAGDAGIASCCKALAGAGIKALVAPRLPDGMDPDEFIASHGIDAWFGHVSQAVAAPEIESHRQVDNADSDIPFRGDVSGVYFRDDSGEEVRWEWICSPLKVLAMTRDVAGEEWGRLLAVTDPDGTEHTWAMPMSMTSGGGDEYRAQLKSLGLRLSPGRKGRDRLDLYLNLYRPAARVRCVNRIGWHGRRFVLPDYVFGTDDQEQVILQGTPRENVFRSAGTLEDWQREIGSLCVGNTRLAFAVSTSLAPALLYLVEMESGGFHIFGTSSTGKTTCLQAAGSVCGGGGLRGFIRQWRTTDNGLESVAAAHCDCLLCLDEMSQVDGRVAGEVAYMLGNGQGKTRARRNGSNRVPQEWRLLFLSTGEITLQGKVTEDGKKKSTAGQSIRVVDIPADAGKGHGIFDELHGFPDGDHFSRHLKESCSKLYGTPLRAFLEAITSQYDQAITAVKGFIREFVCDAAPSDSSGQVLRVCSRFGLVAAAGELASILGIFPWTEGEAKRAALRCFNDWLEHRGGSGITEIHRGIEQVRAFFESHGSSRFEPWAEAGDESRIPNRAGFRRRNAGGEWEYFVHPSVFTTEICRGFDSKLLSRELQQRGLLITGSDGKSAQSVRVPGLGQRLRLYHIASDILSEGGHE